MTVCKKLPGPGGLKLQTFVGAQHPNELDLRRITRAIEKRQRYRYVSPQVMPVDGGYLVTSPCCSRNVDPSGGQIFIALIQFDCDQSLWRIHSRNHDLAEWQPFAQSPRLGEILNCLNEDTDRIFWQ